MNVSSALEECETVLQSVSAAVVADESFLETVLTAVLAEGHVLIEDVPGTGKTLTARSFASALGLSFSRIQFTPDLLPGDITGTHVYREDEGAFTFTEGPIFANFVLADEINRAPPKTQAALLEAMAERQVTVDGETSATEGGSAPTARTPRPSRGCTAAWPGPGDSPGSASTEFRPRTGRPTTAARG